VQEPRPRAGAPVGPQPGVGQVEGDHLAEAAVQRAGDHALAAADLEGAAGPPRQVGGDLPNSRSRFATQRRVSQRMAGLRAVYFWVWLPMTTPSVSGASRCWDKGGAPA
jgi:hypothetical protein